MMDDIYDLIIITIVTKEFCVIIIIICFVECCFFIFFSSKKCRVKDKTTSYEDCTLRYFVFKYDI